MGECPRLMKIFDALDSLARHPSAPDKSREQGIVDRLFIHPKGSCPCPKALATLYTLAWRYIITDFYRIHYDNATFSEESILISVLERFAKLSGALNFANSTDTSRTAQAGMGRQPKKRTDLADIRPLYEIGKNNILTPNEELVSLAAKLGIEHQIARETARQT